MHTLSAALFLASAVVVAIQGDPISEHLEDKPLMEHLYLFDVTSDAPSADVKGALTSLSAFKVRHSLKAVGQNRYVFVVLSTDDVEDLVHLAFPAESEVTQYPIEHASELFAMFGVDAWKEVDDEAELADDTVLLMHDWQFIQLETQCVSTYKREMIDFATKYESIHDTVKPVSYAVIARYPPRMFIFDNMDENAMQNVVEMGMTFIGGPGRSILTTTRMLKF